MPIRAARKFGIFHTTVLVCLTFLATVWTGCTENSESKQLGEPRDHVEGPVPSRVAKTFDYPVGPPGASGYYDAQDFGKNDHLGEDWNADTGGNSDCGDGTFAIENGVVSGVWTESSPGTRTTPPTTSTPPYSSIDEEGGERGRWTCHFDALRPYHYA